jgi:hypothetical protein
MTGIKLMMIGGGSNKEAAGDVSYAAGYSGGVYEPEGWDTVTLELQGVGGMYAYGPPWPYGQGGGTKITKTGVVPADVDLDVGNVKICAGAGGGNGGSGGISSMVPFSGGPGGAATVADIDGTQVVAAGGGGDGGLTTDPAHARAGLPELTAVASQYAAATDKNGADGTPSGGCYYGGGGGGGAGTTGGSSGNPSNGGSGGGNGSTTTGSINFTTRTVDHNTGNGSAKVSWG